MEPKCHLGYTPDQITTLTGDREEEFWRWMRGQTVAVCNAEPQMRWVHDFDAAGRSELVEVGPPLCSVAHGAPIVYVYDMNRFLANLPIID